MAAVEDVQDGFHWKENTGVRTMLLWTVRVGALILLAALWIPLLYFLFVCPECYTPPGQVVDLHRRSKTRLLRTVDYSTNNSNRMDLDSAIRVIELALKSVTEGNHMGQFFRSENDVNIENLNIRI